MAHRQSLLLCLLNGRTGLLVCAFEIYFSLFVRRGRRAGNFLCAAPAFSGAVWGRSRPAAHGRGRCTVGCIVWRINYTPAAVCKSAEYSPWCIVCTKFPPNKMRVYRAAIGAPAGMLYLRGKALKTRQYLEKTTKHLVFPTKYLVLPAKHLACKMLLSAKAF